MPTFDDRENAFESKFAHDAQLLFKAEARRNRLLGLWAAAKLGKSDDEAADYAKEVVRADFQEAGDEDVFRKIAGDLGDRATETEIRVQMDELRAQRAARAAGMADATLAQIKADPNLFQIAMAQGKAAFGDNCAACHGVGGAGAKGYPNLNDDDWLWGGSLPAIQQTIRHGIRVAGDNDTRVSQMPAFGRDGVLKREEILAVASHVRELAGLSTEPKADLKLGRKVFADNCAACHGATGKGNQELGAPNLTDAISLYGMDMASLTETIANSRNGVMPAWAGRLDETTIKALTVYVHSLGGGQ